MEGNYEMFSQAKYKAYNKLATVEMLFVLLDIDNKNEIIQGPGAGRFKQN